MFNKTLDQFKPTIFSVMAAKAIEHQAVNLSQGCPNFDGPSWIMDEVIEAMKMGLNQYAPMPGLPILREEISNYYKKFYDVELDINKEITVTCGATEGIFATIMALVNKGEEVIVMEPFYDSYVASIRLAGGEPVPLTLKAPHFEINFDELEKLISSKTKLIVFNNPHNPTGKVFSKETLQKLVDICEKYNIFLLSDEVYEFLTFNGVNHTPTLKMDKAKSRVIGISSMGKTFGFTGWKIGWVMANFEITQKIRSVHQFLTFSISTPMQYACAKALQRLESYLPDFQKTYQGKMELLFAGLKTSGFQPIKPDGSYFIMCPIKQKTNKDDVEFAMELIEKQKVATIPPSAFYLNSNEGKEYLRFCFAKTDEEIQNAIKNISSS